MVEEPRTALASPIMPELLDSVWFRTTAFGIAVICMGFAWLHERALLARSQDDVRRILWPTCWLLIGSAYAAMGFAIVFHLSGAFGGFGRELAQSEDLYDSRRPVQAVVVAVVGVTWITLVAVGIWRVPERRRRYLASALLCTTLICFALVRVVSLHHIDTVVSRTYVAEVPVGTVVELAAIAAAVVLAFVASHRPILETHTPPAPAATIDDSIVHVER